MKTQQGFSLIELMVVVAIIAILATIAYPAYLTHIRDARRGECQGVMVTAAASLENTYAATGAYPDALPASIPANCAEAATMDFYDLEFSQDALQDFTLTATPKNDQTNDSCGTLTLDHKGVKTVGSSTVDKCW